MLWQRNVPNIYKNANLLFRKKYPALIKTISGCSTGLYNSFTKPVLLLKDIVNIYYFTGNFFGIKL